MLRARDDIAHQCPNPAATGQQLSSRRPTRYATHCALRLLATLGLLMTAPVHAQQAASKPAAAATTQYEALLDGAVDAFEAGDFARAHDLFRQAYALRPNARVSRGLGIAALRLTRYTEARRWLASALADRNQPLTTAQRDEVTSLMSWMDSSLGVLRLHWSGSAPEGNEVLVDEQRVPELTLWLTPGTHRVRARAPGHDSREQSVELAAGSERSLQLSLRPVAAPAEPSARLQREDLLSPEQAAQTMESPAAQGRTAPTALAGREQDRPSVLSRWWFWTAVGAVVAGGVTAGVLLAEKPRPGRGYEPGGEGGMLTARGVLP